MQKAKYIITENFSQTVNCYPTTRSLFRKAKESAFKRIVRIVIMYAIPCALLAWLLLSWANIISHNMSDFNYASWNLFRIFGLR